MSQIAVYGTGGGGSTPAAGASFLAIASINQAIPSLVNTTIIFDTIVYNNGTNFAANSFTAPTSGKLYTFSTFVNCTFASVNDALFIEVNGAQIAKATNAAAAPFTNSVPLQITLELTAGDVVTIVYANTNLLADATVNGGILPYQTWFSGYQIT